MQQDADFIIADFRYMFRASCAHHQEYKILARQPPVQVDMVACVSSLSHIRDETVVSYRCKKGQCTCTGGCRVSIYTPDDGRMTPETCRERLQ